MTDPKPAEWMVKAAQEIVARWSGFDTVIASSWDEPFSEAIARRHQTGCVNFEAHMQAAEMEQAVQELLAAAKLRRVRSGEHTETVWLIDDVDLRRLESAITQVEALLK